jgi:hypothetical protein
MNSGKNMIVEIHPDLKPIRNPAHALREAREGWTTLVNLDNATGIALNDTGIMLWQKIDGRRTVAEIITQVIECFIDVPPTVREDMLAVLNALRDAGLIGFEVTI